MTAFEGVIFDMDGVLINSHPAHRSAWRKFLTSIGKEVDDQQLEYILEGRRREEILRYFLGELSQESLAEYGRQKDRFFQETFSEVQLSRGIPELLAGLERLGVKIGIATSASSRRTWKTLELLEVREKFATVVTGDDVPRGKPDPSVYRLAAQRMKVSAEKLLALEDAPSGVRSAKAAGMRCIGVSGNGHAAALSHAGADCVLESFCELSIQKLVLLWQQMSRPARQAASPLS